MTKIRIVGRNHNFINFLSFLVNILIMAESTSKPLFEPVDDWVDVNIRDFTGIEGHFAPVFTREVVDSEKEELEDGTQVDVDVTMLYGNLDIYNAAESSLTRTSITGIQPAGLQFGQDSWGKYFCRIDFSARRFGSRS